MRDPSNLVARRRVAISRLMDFGGGHRVAQSFSTLALNAVKGSPVYLRVEVSELSEKKNRERDDSEAQSHISVSSCSDGSLATVDGLVGSCSSLSDLYVVVTDVLLGRCCSLTGRSATMVGGMGIYLTVCMRSGVGSLRGANGLLRASTKCAQEQQEGDKEPWYVS